MNDENEPLIRLVGVRKVFYTDEIETHALSDVHLEVQSGQFVEVMGPSGCGKSTLLAIVGLLDAPTEGEYWLEGRPVFRLSGHERARVRNDSIGFIFQAFNLIADMTVFENVELPLTYRGLGQSERRMDHYPGQLSGGQQQRVAAARAVVGHPSILLADEPTGNLDSTNGEAVMKLLRELHAEGTTILMVTHDPRYSRFAERTVHLFDGRIVEESVADLRRAGA